MILKIPTELQKYVRMNKIEGLVCSDDMPEELWPMFEETKKMVIETMEERRRELEALISKDE